MDGILKEAIKIYTMFLASSTLDKVFVILIIVMAIIIVSIIFKKKASQHIGNNSNNNSQIGDNHTRKGR